jgi:hypothetical protein
MYLGPMRVFLSGLVKQMACLTSQKKGWAARIHFVDKSAVAERAAGLFLYANIGQVSRQV